MWGLRKLKLAATVHVVLINTDNLSPGFICVHPVTEFPKDIKKMFKDRLDPDALWLYFECGACGEKIKIRVNRKTDIQAYCAEEGHTGCAYILKKEVLGSKCYNLIFADVRFDAGFGVITSEVKNGRLLTKAEYERRGHV